MLKHPVEFDAAAGPEYDSIPEHETSTVERYDPCNILHLDKRDHAHTTEAVTA
jgi:hypothetical protein